MGLDMMLYKEMFLDSPVELKCGSISKQKTIKIVDKEVIVRVEVAYWRKFYCLHKWFVRNCDDNVEDGKDSLISRTKLEELYELMVKLKHSLVVKDGKIINKELAEELLPSPFPLSNYDEDFYRQVCRTVEQLKPLINSEDFCECDYYYNGVW